MKLRAWGPVVDWMLPLAFGSVLVVALPLRTALEFGTDEGYELMKAFLVSLGHPLYRAGFWNDQPPLHTELLALLFRLFGPSVFVGRLLAVAFAAALVALLYRLVTERSGRIAACVAVALLISSSFFLQLSVSVMLEVPAMTVALASAWACLQYWNGKGRTWLSVSGIVFGCAMQVKATAAIFLPALALEFLVRRIGKARLGIEPRPFRALVLELLIWSGAGMTAFGVVAILFYGPGTVAVFWSSHFSAGTQNAVEPLGFRLESLMGDLGLAFPAIAGLAVIQWKRIWKHRFPLALLLTVWLIHLCHKPYWYYYHLHFAIPLAWLGAVGIVDSLRALWQHSPGASLATKMRLGIASVIWSAAVAMAFEFVPQRAWFELRELSASPLAAEDPSVTALRRLAAQTHWAVADRVIYPFWAGLPVPPELAVMAKKRIWSHQTDERKITECLENYRPEQILLLSDWEQEFHISAYLHEHYEVDPTVGLGTLYLRK